MFLAGGFVLGEAWILCGRAVSENMGAVEKTGRFVIAGVAVAVVVAIVAVLVLMSGNELSNWFSDQFGSPLSAEKYRKRQRERIEERKGKNRQGRFWPFFLSRICGITMMICGLTLIGGIIGAGRATFERNVCEREVTLGLDGEITTITGRVRSVTEKENGWELILDACELENSELDYAGKLDHENYENHVKKRRLLRRILVKINQETEPGFGSGQKTDSEIESGEVFSCGNQVCVTGICYAFDKPRAPGEFDYCTYYRSKKLTYRMIASSVEVRDRRCDWILEALRKISLRASANLERIAGAQDAGILRAVLLGDRTDLPEEVRTLYQENGIAHILALSGLHLSLVSLAVYGLLRKLGVGFGFSAMIAGVVLTGYAWMSGSSASVIRALVMTLCGFGASYLGRTYDRRSALGLAGMILMWDSPYLLTQAGVQLSFGAILGIGLFEEKNGNAGGEESHDTSANAFYAGIGMHAVTFPIVLWHFFQFPLYGIFLNLLIVPFAGILVGSAVTGLVLAEVSVGAGRFAAGGARMLLRWYEWCCRIGARFPGSHLIFGRPRFWQIGVYYGALAGILLFRKWETKPEKREKPEKQVRHEKHEMPGVWLVVALSFLLLPLPHRGLDVTFLDVGQGDGICIRADSSVILVDGGSSDEKNLGKNRLVPFIKSSGIRRIDSVIVSHGDSDHISGLVWLFQEEEDIGIRQLILPKAGQADEAYQTLIEQADRRGCRVIWMERGDRIEIGKLRIQCLYPQGEDEGAENRRNLEEMAEKALADRNEQSLVLRVEYGKFAMLLTGDMSEAGEAALLECENTGSAENRAGSAENASEVSGENGLEGIFLLKSAHHGSRFSNSEEWLDAVNPQITVISYGKDNRYGHPHEETIERLRERKIKVIGTGQDGSVFFHTDGEKVSWRCWSYGYGH
ncbi:ComEC/Rec2 family competence protein [Brotaphodocola catenula]|uniref:Competence protein ComEC family protein n=1 Tax=Brotaphodocola catenula TaxID=2885361 RepID=A0AAE3AS27_9FIRM|nr:ComEC/Rec2 family competence protein [Brotaphodocola catenula]MCC2165670.1 competence protein ComEC family protein [Brotaphodocola catenula]